MIIKEKRFILLSENVNDNIFNVFIDYDDKLTVNRYQIN